MARVKCTIDFLHWSCDRAILATLFVVAAVIIGGCGSSSSVSTAPTEVKCEVSLGSLATVEASGGRVSFGVTAKPECAWEASTTASWISALSPASGRGDGTISFTVALNESTVSRDGAIKVNEQQVMVTQAAAVSA